MPIPPIAFADIRRAMLRFGFPMSAICFNDLSRGSLSSAPAPAPVRISSFRISSFCASFCNSSTLTSSRSMFYEAMYEMRSE
jgi:hypothetical protein